MPKIFIDPGHGGSDPGAVGNGLQEKNLTLSIATRLRDILLNEYQNVEVKMSRTSDVFIGLSQRATMANQWGADYFVSIHINAGGGTGFESYVHSSLPAGAVAKQKIIHPEIVNAMKVKDRGMKNANFAVLRETVMDALLTENLFIDNSTDAQKLASASFLQTIALGHANGIAKAFGLKRKDSSSPNYMYRVIVDGTQTGAYSLKENILNEVGRHIGTATNILVQKV